MNVRDWINDKILIFDGAMGTMLQQRGLVPGALPELLNITDPDTVTDIHREYVLAGADVITANTFRRMSSSCMESIASRRSLRRG